MSSQLAYQPRKIAKHGAAIAPSMLRSTPVSRPAPLPSTASSTPICASRLAPLPSFPSLFPSNPVRLHIHLPSPTTHTLSRSSAALATKREPKHRRCFWEYNTGKREKGWAWQRTQQNSYTQENQKGTKRNRGARVQQLYARLCLSASHSHFFPPGHSSCFPCNCCARTAKAAMISNSLGAIWRPIKLMNPSRDQKKCAKPTYRCLYLFDCCHGKVCKQPPVA